MSRNHRPGPAGGNVVHLKLVSSSPSVSTAQPPSAPYTSIGQALVVAKCVLIEQMDNYRLGTARPASVQELQRANVELALKLTHSALSEHDEVVRKITALFKEVA